MASRAEESTCRLLWAILADLPTGDPIPDSDYFREALGALEFYLSELFSETLDGIIPLVARKLGDDEVEIFGVGILISDQTVTPLALQLQFVASGDAVSWLEGRLGERGDNGMVRTPYDSLHVVTKRLRKLGCRTDAIDWVDVLSFGQRRV